MKLYCVEGKDFVLAHGRQRCAWVGSECSGCRQFLVPIRIPEGEEIVEDAWSVRPSQSGRPIIQANCKSSPGTICKLSSFDKPGKVYGRIFVHKGEPLLVSSGIGKRDGSFYEDAILIVNEPTSFVVWQCSGEDILIRVDNGRVEIQPVLPEMKPFVNILALSDSLLKRWNYASKNEKE
jgi:hypothetical protein